MFCLKYVDRFGMIKQIQFREGYEAINYGKRLLKMNPKTSYMVVVSERKNVIISKLK